LVPGNAALCTVQRGLIESSQRGLTNRGRTNRGLTEGLHIVHGELTEGSQGYRRLTGPGPGTEGSQGYRRLTGVQKAHRGTEGLQGSKRLTWVQ